MIHEFVKSTFGNPAKRWKHLINFLIFAVLAWWLLPNPNAPRHTLRVMTYNIRHGLGMDRLLRLERVAEVINDFRPDIVVLNEVDMGTKRSEDLREVDVLTHLTKLNGYFARSIDFDGGEYGNALLSRWKIAQPLQVWDISDSIGREGRSVFRAVVTYDADTVQVFGTHLGLIESERHYQVRFIDSLLVHFQDRYPILLMGDFNFSRKSTAYRILTHRIPDTYAFLGYDSVRTYPAPKPDHTLDYIFASPDWSGLQALFPHPAVMDTASDHFPIRLVLHN